MKSFNISIPVEAYEEYRVYAENAEEALEIYNKYVHDPEAFEDVVEELGHYENAIPNDSPIIEESKR